MKPSHIHLVAPHPLEATFGATEVEQAVALVVRANQALGDAWQALAWSDIAEVLRQDVESGQAPFASLVHQPIFRPDLTAAVNAGYAQWAPGEPGRVELTQKAIALLEASRWHQPPRA